MPPKRKRKTTILSFISKHAQANRIARRNETPQQAELRRHKQALRTAANRAKETPEQTQARRRRCADVMTARRAAETPEQTHARIQKIAAYKASRRARETPEMAQARRQRNSELLAAKRAAETPEQSRVRRQQQANYMAYRRAVEQVVAESSKHAVADRHAQLPQTFTSNMWEFSKTAFVDYKTHKLIKIKAMTIHCKNCGALKWKKEADTALKDADCSFETQQVDSIVYPRCCEEVKLEQDDPLSLPGPSCECTDKDNVKLEYQTETQETKPRLGCEEFETKDGFYEIMVKKEIDETNGDNSEYQNAADDEDTDRKFVPRVVLK